MVGLSETRELSSLVWESKKLVFYRPFTFSVLDYLSEAGFSFETFGQIVQSTFNMEVLYMKQGILISQFYLTCTEYMLFLRL